MAPDAGGRTVAGMIASANDALQVVVAGGGVAGLESVLALRALAQDRVGVELLSREPSFSYRPLAVAEPFGLGTVRRVALDRVASALGIAVRRGTVVGVDADAHVAHTAEGDDVPYDAL